MRHQSINNDGEELSSAYVEHSPVDVHFVDQKGEPEVSLTRQEFADECDINNIMAKYKTTGVLQHINATAPVYYDFSETPDLASALAMLREADEAFMRLPATARREFDNDPTKFVMFAEDPDNLPKMREWGLAEPEKAPDPIMKVEVVNPPPLDPKPL